MEKELPNIFLLFFSIFYGSVFISKMNHIEPFGVYSLRDSLRFGFSFIFINIIPILFFSHIYLKLNSIKNPEDAWSIAMVALSAIFLVLGHYRLIFCSLLFWPKEWSSERIQHLQKTSMKEKFEGTKKKVSKEKWGYLTIFFGSIYLAVSMTLLFFLKAL